MVLKAHPVDMRESLDGDNQYIFTPPSQGHRPSARGKKRSGMKAGMDPLDMYTQKLEKFIDKNPYT